MTERRMTLMGNACRDKIAAKEDVVVPLVRSTHHRAVCARFNIEVHECCGRQLKFVRTPMVVGCVIAMPIWEPDLNESFLVAMVSP